MIVRACTEADLAHVHERWPTPADVAGAHFARQEAGDATFLVAWDGDEPAGHAVIQWDDTGVPAEVRIPDGGPSLGHVFVRESFRRRGVATHLVGAAEVAVRERGHASLALWVGLDNHDARQLYERLGYTPTGQRTQYSYRWVDDDGVAHDAYETDELLTKVVPSAHALAFKQLCGELGENRWTCAPWRSGVDYVADLVTAGDGTVAGVLRRPRHESVPTGYDGLVDFAALVETEVAVLQLMRAHEVQVPRVLAWHRAYTLTDVSWMFLEYVPHEPVHQLSSTLQRELGTIARRIHAIVPKPTDVPMLHRDGTWASYFTARLEKRLEAAAAYCDESLPVAEVLTRAAEVVAAREPFAHSLLHLDLRPDNLCVRADHIVAVLDVSNAVIGDPLLELARIRAHGNLTRSFLDGYLGRDLTADELRALDVYELDTRAMLAAVAREEIDDAALFEASRTRTIELCAELARAGIAHR